jgi:hypothetical protein
MIRQTEKLCFSKFFQEREREREGGEKMMTTTTTTFPHFFSMMMKVLLTNLILSSHPQSFYDFMLWSSEVLSFHGGLYDGIMYSILFCVFLFMVYAAM